MERKGAIWGDYLVFWMIALLILVLSLVVYGIFSGRLDSFVEFIGNFLRFRR